MNMGNVVVQAGGAIGGGVVQSPEGIPVREAAVTAQSASGAVFFTTTDLDGVFRLDGLPDGVYVVSVLSDKHTGGQVDGVVVAAGGPAARASLQVRAAGAISGSIVGLPAPLPAGASAYAMDASGVIWGADEPAADGSFQITGLPDGLYSVTAFVPGKLASTVTGVQVTAGFTVNVAAVQLSPAGGIQGAVTLPTGKPLLEPGRVTFTSAGRPDTTVALEADLSFTAPTLVPGNYTLTGGIL